MREGLRVFRVKTLMILLVLSLIIRRMEVER